MARFDSGWKPTHKAAVPVVSIGNLTVGGTGKTPAVEYVARYYRERGARPTILSRGYGANGGLNDEALVLAENLPDVPHLQGADRVALALCAAASEGKQQDLLVSKAVAVLDRLRVAGYFAKPDRRLHLIQDPSFAGVRGHAALLGFVESLGK